MIKSNIKSNQITVNNLNTNAGVLLQLARNRDIQIARILALSIVLVQLKGSLYRVYAANFFKLEKKNH